jgi:hypothetical protein
MQEAQEQESSLTISLVGSTEENPKIECKDLLPGMVSQLCVVDLSTPSMSQNFRWISDFSFLYKLGVHTDKLS